MLKAQNKENGKRLCVFESKVKILQDQLRGQSTRSNEDDNGTMTTTMLVNV